MIASKDNILSFIPQRDPFVMIDELVYSDESLTRSAFLVRDDNIFVTGSRFREPGLVENIAQTAAARMGHISRQGNRPVAIGYIGSIKDLQVFDLPTTGETIETEVVIENQVFEVTIITGTVRCNDIVLARCEMKIFITP